MQKPRTEKICTIVSHFLSAGDICKDYDGYRNLRDTNTHTFFPLIILKMKYWKGKKEEKTLLDSKKLNIFIET